MKVHSQHSEFRSLTLLSVFMTVIVLASCSSLPISRPGSAEQEQSSNSNPSSDEVDSGMDSTTPNSDAENSLVDNGGVSPPPRAVHAGPIDEDRLSDLNSLAPAINPMNAEDVESVDPFFLPIIIGGGGYGRGWGRGWGGGRWGGGGWGGRWGGGGWGGRWGGGGWGGRWGGGGWRG